MSRVTTRSVEFLRAKGGRRQEDRPRHMLIEAFVQSFEQVRA